MSVTVSKLQSNSVLRCDSESFSHLCTSNNNNTTTHQVLHNSSDLIVQSPLTSLHHCVTDITTVIHLRCSSTLCIAFLLYGETICNQSEELFNGQISLIATTALHLMKIFDLKILCFYCFIFIVHAVYYSSKTLKFIHEKFLNRYSKLSTEIIIYEGNSENIRIEIFYILYTTLCSHLKLFSTIK